MLPSRQDIYDILKRVVNHKPSGQFTEHDKLPEEIVQDDSRIAYVVEDLSDDYSVVSL